MTRRNVLPWLPIWVQQRNFRLCVPFDSCRTTPHLNGGWFYDSIKPQPPSGHGSRLLAPVCVALGRWVKWPWSRTFQTSWGLLVPFVTVDCCGRWQACGADMAWLLSPANSMTFQKRWRHQVFPLSFLALHQSIANRSLCTVSSRSPRNLYGKEIFPL